MVVKAELLRLKPAIGGLYVEAKAATHKDFGTALKIAELPHKSRGRG